MDDKTIIKIEKVIRDDNISLNDLFIIITHLYNKYIKLLIQDQIIKYNDNKE